MKSVVFVAMFLLAVTVLAQEEVEISTERDANGKFINPAVLTVTWEESAGEKVVYTDVPDPVSTDDDTLQEWYVPISGTDYWKFSFTKNEKGEYAVRWRPDADSLWSDWASVTIVKVKPPKHVD